MAKKRLALWQRVLGGWFPVEKAIQPRPSSLWRVRCGRSVVSIHAPPGEARRGGGEGSSVFDPRVQYRCFFGALFHLVKLRLSGD
jgi:hypothetical protein